MDAEQLKKKAQQEKEWAAISKETDDSIIADKIKTNNVSKKLISDLKTIKNRDGKDDEKSEKDKLRRKIENEQKLKELEAQKELNKGGTPEQIAQKEIDLENLVNKGKIQSLKEKLSEENDISLEKLNTELSNGELKFASLEELEYQHALKIIAINEDKENKLKKIDSDSLKEDKKNKKEKEKLDNELAQSKLALVSGGFQFAKAIAGRMKNYREG